MHNHHLVSSAKEVVALLTQQGHIAYFAGGYVRDLLLNLPSHDIDIATSACIEQIQALFPKTIPVGIAFNSILVLHKGCSIEVSSFRQDVGYQDGRHPEYVIAATAYEDAQRRDFTINGLFFDPLEKKILDFVQGESDLKQRIIRCIGNPIERFTEDRLRMLRAIRFAVKLGFDIEASTALALKQLSAQLFPAVSVERVWNELEKMSQSNLAQSMQLLYEFGLFSILFPWLQQSQEWIYRKCSCWKHLPCQLIFYLENLFKDTSHEIKKNFCEFYKLSKTDQNIIFTYEVWDRLLSTSSLVQWAHMYADPLSEAYLICRAAELNPEQKNLFFQEHEVRKSHLHQAIQRIIHKNPVINGAVLQSYGIPPGIKLGKLLKEAERLSIEEGLDTQEALIARLKNSVFWKHS